MQKKVYVVAGGTFDHLHDGHKLFLRTALTAGTDLIIGITSDPMARKKGFSESVEPYKIRQPNVKRFISSIKQKTRVRFVKLHEPFGLSIINPKIEKIVVTEETKITAEKINIIRKKNRLKALKIILVPYVKDEKNGVISSFRIRKGEVSRRGQLWNKQSISRNSLYLPNTLRPILRQPLGRVFIGKNRVQNVIQSLKRGIFQKKPVSRVICVGDIVSLTFLKHGYIPSLMVYDLKTQREALKNSDVQKLYSHNQTQIGNPAGMIDKNAVTTIQKLFDKILTREKKERLFVKGEEDLLVLPVLLMAPLQSVVCYGQRDLGVVVVEVTEERKQFVYNLIRKFD